VVRERVKGLWQARRKIVTVARELSEEVEEREVVRGRVEGSWQARRKIVTVA
jgi:hypothetical protein